MSEENKNYSLDNENGAPKKESAYSALEHLYGDGDGEDNRDRDKDKNKNNKSEKEPRRITLSAFIFSAIALVLVTAMLTWSLCLGAYRARLAEEIGGDKAFGDMSDIDKLDTIFKMYSYGGVDEDAINEILPKAYVAASGDRYAEYFTEEEYAAYMSSVGGNSVGVGINIIDTTVKIGGVDYEVLKVINVTRESPAMRAGVRVGDLVAYVGADKQTRESVDSLGYEATMTRLLGDEGTKAEFTVLRPTEAGYEEVPFSIIREKIKSESVYYRVCGTDASVGIIKILQFDYTTPKQFSAAMDALRAEGISKFIFDVRYNGGGSLDSIVAVLSYFLDEGQTIIRTVDNKGTEEITKVAPVSNLKGEAALCNVKPEDIGKYKGLDVAVLCNEATASAAELFVATFRDYELATTVGAKTFGKGSMQQMMSLKVFGLNGVLKLTTHMYFPPLGEGYDGKGIEPDVTVALDEALKNKNIYDITDAEDNQLQAAIKELN